MTNCGVDYWIGGALLVSLTVLILVVAYFVYSAGKDLFK